MSNSKTVTIFTKQHSVYMSTQVKDYAWTPALSNEVGDMYTEEQADAHARAMLEKLKTRPTNGVGILKVCYPQPSIGFSIIAYELWLARNDKQKIQAIKGF